MKIGLITYHSVCNFGANLQALSTVSYLRNKGIEVFVINWYPKDLENIYINIIKEEQRKEHELFVNTHLPITRRCNTSNDVKKIIKELKFDAVIIGSDAVFSYKPFLCRIHPSRKTLIGVSKVSSDHKIPNPFWADFKSNDDSLKVFALSASAQYLDIDRCLPWEISRIRQSLNKFCSLNVRDSWTQMIISKILNKNVPITPDPVFAFNKNVDIQISCEDILAKYNLPSKYIITSFCSLCANEDWYDSLYGIWHENGYYVVNLAMPEGCVRYKCDKNIDIPLPPLDWYFLIKYSHAYIGQRMHPMIVAYHNKVPFFIFDHYAYKTGENQLKSSKIYDLLKRSDLLENYCNIKKDSVPSAKHIYDSIYNFKHRAANVFLEQAAIAYDKMMNDIIAQI